MTSQSTLTPITTNSNGAGTDPFASIPGATLARDLPMIMPLRLAIVGPTGMGHSWLACTAPKPILVYDFDNRAASIRGKPGVAVKTLVDDPNNPQVMNILENDLIMIKAAKAAKQPIPATIVLDSGTYLKKSMENALMKQQPQFANIAVKMGSKTLLSASAMMTATVIRDYFAYWINEFGSLGNIIVTFHVKDELDKDKTTKEKPVYTGKQTIEPQYLDTVLSIFNERWRINKEFAWNATTNSTQAKYVVHTRNDDLFNAITSLEIDDKEEADIEKILAKHAARVQAKVKV